MGSTGPAASRICGARSSRLRRARGSGQQEWPVCIAKTQYSLSDDPAVGWGGRQEHEFTVRDVRPSAGAGFVVIISGEIMTMPGLPSAPGATRFDHTAESHTALDLLSERNRPAGLSSCLNFATPSPAIRSTARRRGAATRRGSRTQCSDARAAVSAAAQSDLPDAAGRRMGCDWPGRNCLSGADARPSSACCCWAPSTARRGSRSMRPLRPDQFELCRGRLVPGWTASGRANVLDADDAGIAAQARAFLDWHRAAPFLRRLRSANGSGAGRHLSQSAPSCPPSTFRAPIPW